MQNNPDELSEILNIFQVESTELLKKLGDYTLTLENNPENTEMLSLMFQTLHSLKGSARMLGFTELQSIAHHLEDILTLVKTHKKDIDSKFFELLYSSFDILQTGINECVEKQENTPLDEEIDLLNKLDEYIKGNPDIPVQNVDKLMVDYIKDKSAEINAYILELFVLFRKCEGKKIESFDETFMILSDISKQLSAFFVETDFEAIKTLLNLLNYSCNIDEDDKNLSALNKCRELVYSLKDEINKLYTTLGLECLISEEDADVAVIEKKKETPVQLSKHEKETVEIINLLDENLIKLKESPEPIIPILNLIHKFLVMDITENVSAIMQKMSDMLNFLTERNIEPDMSIVNIFLYCFNIIKKSLSEHIPLTKEDTSICIEKLALIEKIFSISSETELPQIRASKAIKGSEVTDGSTELLHKKPIDNKAKENLQNFFKIFENEEIKTLRVDTVKLDKLVSQTGELIINVIKTQEHLSVIEKLNTKLSNWYSESKKIANFLKYFDKRIVINNTNDDISVNFYRKVFSYFYENAAQINEFQSDINYLFKKVLEDDTKLNQVIMEVENISKNIRVLPLATVFHMFPRMVRDIAKNANKEIDIIIKGSDTAVDKKIIEEIKTPLIHILRNAIDHGIELPEEREQKGKNRVGQILLTAAQDKNSIIITIEDDGVGINVKKIREKALERQLLTKEEIDAMSDEQMTGLIFWPGFSTGEKITEISGRGIGLDVVQTKLAQLNGKINVVSVMDKGCKVIIELPITMSTTKVFVISFGGQYFAIPMSSIKLVQWIKPGDIFTKDGKDCILFDEHSIPIFDLAKVLNVKSSYKNKKDNLTVIVVEVENTTIAYIVEKLFGDMEILNKKLSLPIYKLKNIGGITTLPSGDICLVMNMNEVVRNSLALNNNKKYHSDLYKLSTGRTEDDFNPTEKLINIFDSTGKLTDYLSKCLQYFGYRVNAFSDKDIFLSAISKTKPHLLVCNFENNMQQEKDIIYKIKGDEDLSDIKLVLVSTLSQNRITQLLPDINIPLTVKKTDYSEDKFLNDIERLLK